MIKRGDRIGTPVTVERSVNDLVLVDDALDESMLKPELQNNELKENDDQDSGNEDVTLNENQDMQGVVNDTEQKRE